jgi:hypothetical protein
MSSNRNSISRPYNNQKITEWALLLTSLVLLFAVMVPWLPTVWAQIERIAEKEIEVDRAYNCEQLGAKVGTQKYNDCLLSLKGLPITQPIAHNK